MLKFDIKTLRVWDTKLNTIVQKMSKGVHRPKEVTKKISFEAYKDIIKHFNEEMGPKKAWAPLTEATKKGKRKAVKNRILYDSGKMLRSIRPASDEKAAYVISPATDRGKNYGKFHHIEKGFKGFGGSHVPSRPFLWLSASAKMRIIGIVRDGMRNIWR